MTIGEALREQQIFLGLSNKQMAAGIVSEATYSKVINNRQNISSDLLIKLLLFHDINLSDFFERIESEYQTQHKVQEKKILKKLTIAVNNNSLDEANTYFKKLIKISKNRYLLMRVNVAIAYLNKDLNEISSEFKRAVVDTINSNSNWVMNIEALRLFSTAMVILPEKIVEEQMKLFFLKIKRKKCIISEGLQERYAMICDNYLHWKYEHLESNKEYRNIEHALHYLSNLPAKTNMVIFRISGVYYQKLFAGDVKGAKRLRKQLLDMGCTTGVKNWPV